MKKSKVVLAAGILGSAAYLIKKKLENETVTKQLIPRHWDQEEINQRMADFTQQLAEGNIDALVTFALGNEARHFKSFIGQELTFLEAHVVSLFKVKGDSYKDFLNFRIFFVAQS